LIGILRKRGFIVKAEAVELAYSVFQKKYILKQAKGRKEGEEHNN